MSFQADFMERQLAAAAGSGSPAQLEDAFRYLTTVLEDRVVTRMPGSATGPSVALFVTCCEVALRLEQWHIANECVQRLACGPPLARDLQVRALFCDAAVTAHNVAVGLRGEALLAATTESLKKVIYGIKLAMTLHPIKQPRLIDAGVKSIWNTARRLYRLGNYAAIVDVIGFAVLVLERFSFAGQLTKVMWLLRYATCLSGSDRSAEAAVLLARAADLAASVDSPALVHQISRMQAVVSKTGPSATGGSTGRSTAARQDGSKAAAAAATAGTSTAIWGGIHAAQAYFSGALAGSAAELELRAAVDELMATSGAPPTAATGGSGIAGGTPAVTPTSSGKSKAKRATPQNGLVAASQTSAATISSSKAPQEGLHDRSRRDEALAEVILALAMSGDGEYSAAALNTVLNGKSVLVRVLGDYAQAFINAHKAHAFGLLLATDTSSLTRTNVTALRKAAQDVDRAMDVAANIRDVRDRQLITQMGCVLLWNLCLPLLQKGCRGPILPYFDRAARRLSTMESNLIRLYYLLEFECSRAEFASDRVQDALSRLQRISSIEYTGFADDPFRSASVISTWIKSQWMQRRAMARLSPSINPATAAPEDLALHLLEQTSLATAPARKLLITKVLGLLTAAVSASSNGGDGVGHSDEQSPSAQLLSHSKTNRGNGNRAEDLRKTPGSDGGAHGEYGAPAGAQTPARYRREGGISAEHGGGRRGQPHGTSAQSKPAAALTTSQYRALLLDHTIPIAWRGRREDMVPLVRAACELLISRFQYADREDRDFIHMQASAHFTIVDTYVVEMEQRGLHIGQSLGPCNVGSGGGAATGGVTAPQPGGTSYAQKKSPLAPMRPFQVVRGAGEGLERISSGSSATALAQGDSDLQAVLLDYEAKVTAHLAQVAHMSSHLKALGFDDRWIAANAAAVLWNLYSAGFRDHRYYIRAIRPLEEIYSVLIRVFSPNLEPEDVALLKDIAFAFVSALLQQFVAEVCGTGMREGSSARQMKELEALVTRVNIYTFSVAPPSASSGAAALSTPGAQAPAPAGGGNGGGGNAPKRRLASQSFTGAQGPLQKAMEVCQAMMSSLPTPMDAKHFCMFYACITRLLGRAASHNGSFHGLGGPKMGGGSEHRFNAPQYPLLILLGQLEHLTSPPISAEQAGRAEQVAQQAMQYLLQDPNVELCARLAIHAQGLPGGETLVLRVCAIGEELYQEGKLGWKQRSVKLEEPHAPSALSASSRTNVMRDRGQDTLDRYGTGGGSAEEPVVGRALPLPTREDWFWFSQMLLCKAQATLRRGTATSGDVLTQRGTRIEALVAVTNSAIAAARAPAGQRLQAVLNAYRLYSQYSMPLESDAARRSWLLPSLRIILSPAVYGTVRAHLPSRTRLRSEDGPAAAALEASRHHTAKLALRLWLLLLTCLDDAGAHEEGFQIISQLLESFPPKYHQVLLVLDVQFRCQLSQSVSRVLARIREYDKQTQASVWMKVARYTTSSKEKLDAYLTAADLLRTESPPERASVLLALCQWLLEQNRADTTMSMASIVTLLESAVDAVLPLIMPQRQLREWQGACGDALDLSTLESSSGILAGPIAPALPANGRGHGKPGRTLRNRGTEPDKESGEGTPFVAYEIAVKALFLLFKLAPFEPPTVFTAGPTAERPAQLHELSPELPVAVNRYLLMIIYMIQKLWERIAAAVNRQHERVEQRPHLGHRPVGSELESEAPAPDTSACSSVTKTPNSPVTAATDSAVTAPIRELPNGAFQVPSTISGWLGFSMDSRHLSFIRSLKEPYALNVENVRDVGGFVDTLFEVCEELLKSSRAEHLTGPLLALIHAVIQTSTTPADTLFGSAVLKMCALRMGDAVVRCVGSKGHLSAYLGELNDPLPSAAVRRALADQCHGISQRLRKQAAVRANQQQLRDVEAEVVPTAFFSTSCGHLHIFPYWIHEASMLLDAGQLNKASELLHMALEFARILSDWLSIARCHYLQVQLLLAMGMPEEAQEFVRLVTDALRESASSGVAQASVDFLVGVKAAELECLLATGREGEALELEEMFERDLLRAGGCPGQKAGLLTEWSAAFADGAALDLASRFARAVFYHRRRRRLTMDQLAPFTAFVPSESLIDTDAQVLAVPKDSIDSMIQGFTVQVARRLGDMSNDTTGRAFHFDPEAELVRLRTKVTEFELQTGAAMSIMRFLKSDGRATIQSPAKRLMLTAREGQLLQVRVAELRRDVEVLLPPSAKTPDFECKPGVCRQLAANLLLLGRNILDGLEVRRQILQAYREKPEALLQIPLGYHEHLQHHVVAFFSSTRRLQETAMRKLAERPQGGHSTQDKGALVGVLAQPTPQLLSSDSPGNVADEARLVHDTASAKTNVVSLQKEPADLRQGKAKPPHPVPLPLGKRVPERSTPVAVAAAVDSRSSPANRGRPAPTGKPPRQSTQASATWGDFGLDISSPSSCPAPITPPAEGDKGEEDDMHDQAEFTGELRDAMNAFGIPPDVGQVMSRVNFAEALACFSAAAEQCIGDVYLSRLVYLEWAQASLLHNIVSLVSHEHRQAALENKATPSLLTCPTLAAKWMLPINLPASSVLQPVKARDGAEKGKRRGLPKIQQATPLDASAGLVSSHVEENEPTAISDLHSSLQASRLVATFHLLDTATALAVRCVDFDVLQRTLMGLANCYALAGRDQEAGSAIERVVAAKVSQQAITTWRVLVPPRSQESLLYSSLEWIKREAPHNVSTPAFGHIVAKLRECSPLFQQVLPSEWIGSNDPLEDAKPLGVDVCVISAAVSLSRDSVFFVVRRPDGHVDSRNVQLQCDSIEQCTTSWRQFAKQRVEHLGDLGSPATGWAQGSARGALPRSPSASRETGRDETTSQERSGVPDTARADDEAIRDADARDAAALRDVLRLLDRTLSPLWADFVPLLSSLAKQCRLVLCLDPLLQPLPLEKLPPFTAFRSVHRELSLPHLRKRLLPPRPEKGLTGVYAMAFVDALNEAPTAPIAVRLAAERTKGVSIQLLCPLLDANERLRLPDITHALRQLGSRQTSPAASTALGNPVVQVPAAATRPDSTVEVTDTPEILLANLCGSLPNSLHLPTLATQHLQRLRIAAVFDKGINSAAARRENKQEMQKSEELQWVEQPHNLAVLLLTRGVGMVVLNSFAVSAVRNEEMTTNFLHCLGPSLSGGNGGAGLQHVSAMGATVNGNPSHSKGFAEFLERINGDVRAAYAADSRDDLSEPAVVAATVMGGGGNAAAAAFASDGFTNCPVDAVMLSAFSATAWGVSGELFRSSKHS